MPRGRVRRWRPNAPACPIGLAVALAAVALVATLARADSADLAAGPRLPGDGGSRVFLPLVTQALPVPRFASDLHAARARYPIIIGTQLNHCRLCHMADDRFIMNPYGRDYRDSGRDFAAIEPLDSDGDGFANLDEILALTFPGYADSHPRAAP